MEYTDVLTPDNLRELRDALEQATPNSKILAGGTDLVLAIHENRCKPEMLVDLSGVKELKSINFEDGCLHIGAMATFTRIKENEAVRKYAQCLADAASVVGSNQIRNVGTIGGNVGNASPAGDIIPVLMALEARIRIMDSMGHIDEKDVDEIIIGSGRTSLQCDQVITDIIIPTLGDGYRSTFVKLGSRTAVTIAKLNIALIVKYDQAANTISDVRVGLGAIGVKAFRDLRVEGIMNGRQVSEDLAELFAEELSITVQKAIPGRYSLPYKMEAIKGLAHDAFDKLNLP